MSTYVMSAAVKAWKKAAMTVLRPDRYAPRRVQRARKPVRRAMTAKKRAIR